jgi:hypothetical protein
MEYCEFLLQKEGDRAWLPLESPSVEVLEGRYRLIARSSYPDTAVEIQVGYQPDRDTLPGSQRTQVRSAQTNNNGLVVVIPFTTLKPGQWLFSCERGEPHDRAADAAPNGAGWRYAVTLQVLAVEAEDWVDVDPQPAAAEAEAIGDRTDASIDRATAALMEDAAPSAIADWPEPSLPAAPIAPEPPSPPPVMADQPATDHPVVDQPAATPVAPDRTIPLPALQPTEPFTPPIERLIQVEDDRLLRIADRLLQQMVEPPNPTPEEATDWAAQVAQLPPLQLRLDRTTYITAWGESLTLQGTLEPDSPNSAPPIAQLPPTLEWRVTLRDPNSQRILVRLRQPIAASRWTRSGEGALPGQFACSVELPIEANTFLMLGELALYPDGLPSATPLATQAFAVAADADALLKAIEPNFRPEQCTDEERTSAVLPEEPLPFRPTSKKGLNLDLLNFVQPATGQAATPPPTPIALPSIQQPLPDPTIDPQLLQGLQGLPSQPPQPAPPSPHPNPIAPPPREPSLFDALPLGDRFRSRLTAFAEDSDLLAWMRARGDGVAPAPEAPDPDADWTAGEVLVDDVIPVLGQSIPRSEPPPSDAVLPAAAFIPTPELEVLTNPLVADGTATVRLRVREVPSRLCVKVWTSDRQTRQILEPPRWVLELQPNGLGELETRVTLSVPSMVAELSIEAVTVELATHRESRKTELVLPVLPPDARSDRPELDPLAINTLFEALSPSRWD